MKKKYLDSDLKIVLIYVLKRIWIVLIPALILGGYLGYSRGKALAEAKIISFKEQGLENVESVKAEMSEQDIADAEGFFAADQAFHKFLVFMSDSVRMNIDATNAPETVLTYRIESENDVNQIRDLYKAMYLQGCDVAMDVTGGSLLLYKAGDTESVFSVVVLGNTLEESSYLAQKIKSRTESMSQDISETGLTHSLYLVDEVTSYFEESELRREQLANIDQIKLSADSLNDASASISNSARRLYNVMQNESVGGPSFSQGTPEYDAIMSNTFSFFYAIIGAALGGVAGLLVIIVLYTFKPYVHTSKELENIFEAETFENTSEESNSLFINSLVLYMSRKGYKTIGLYSTNYDNNKNKILWIKDELEKKNFSISVFEKPIEKGEELLELSQQDAMITVEKLNKSKIKKMMKVKDICDKYDILITGVVAL